MNNHGRRQVLESGGANVLCVMFFCYKIIAHFSHAHQSFDSYVNKKLGGFSSPSPPIAYTHDNGFVSSMNLLMLKLQGSSLVLQHAVSGEYKQWIPLDWTGLDCWVKIVDGRPYLHPTHF